MSEREFEQQPDLFWLITWLMGTDTVFLSFTYYSKYSTLLIDVFSRIYFSLLTAFDQFAIQHEANRSIGQDSLHSAYLVLTVLIFCFIYVHSFFTAYSIWKVVGRAETYEFFLARLSKQTFINNQSRPQSFNIPPGEVFSIKPLFRHFQKCFHWTDI